MEKRVGHIYNFAEKMLKKPIKFQKVKEKVKEMKSFKI